jgi:hypothetical protein
MDPTLRDGDWLLVDPRAFEVAPPQVGDLVMATDPRTTGRSLIKRVKSVGSNGVLSIGGDHPAHAEEELDVASRSIHGRPWFRYWPLRRAGRIR